MRGGIKNKVRRGCVQKNVREGASEEVAPPPTTNEFRKF